MGEDPPGPDNDYQFPMPHWKEERRMRRTASTDLCEVWWHPIENCYKIVLYNGRRDETKCLELTPTQARVVARGLQRKDED